MRHEMAAVANETPFRGADRDSVNEIQVDEALASVLTLPLDSAVAALCAEPELDAWFEAAPGRSEAFLAKLRETVARAFGAREAAALAEVHAALFTLYDLHVADGTDARALNQFNPLLTQARRVIERAWLASERERVSVQTGVTDSAAVVSALKGIWSGHRAASHPLFDFLEKDATREQIVTFFRSDSALNIRFFDLLLYSLIGSRVEVRKELMQNLWDEAGRGNPSLSHVSLFRRLLDVVGVGQAPDSHASQLEVDGHAGYNLFMLTSLNRAHYFMLLGVMAMTELLDPSQYEKLVRGCKRVGFGANGELAYYEEHVTIDIVHAQGWLDDVIVPVVQQTPSVGDDILFGAALRMATCEAYYDALYAKLTALPAGRA
ncbi:hypothetical protein B7759_03914 [Burkholderia glumae]|nr:hypothetical protein CG017_03342 [Burkholderia glumae]QTP35291.1 hypothetical protein B7759_03914 [Burkholderia glumae]